MVKKGFFMCLALVTSIFIFSPLSTFASQTAGNLEKEVEKGEVILKYTAPDVDWSLATKEQMRTLKEIGWKKENGVYVQYRSVSEEITEAIDEGFLTPLDEELTHGIASFENQEVNKEDEDTLIVNGEETEIKDGRFEVKGNPETVEIQVDDETTKTVKKDDDGKYRLVLEKNLSDIIEKMDNHDEMHSMNQSLFNVISVDYTSTISDYGDTYSPGDWVHCNRFNGPHSDDRHLRKWNPQAIINFYHSDCDYGALRYCKSHNNCNQKYRAAYCSYKLGHSTKYHRH